MSDENTTDPPASKDAADKATPPAAPDAPKHGDGRAELRVRVRWHVDAFVEGQAVLHGFVRDLSLKGADIFLGRNLQSVKSIKLHIHVPPLSVTEDHHIVEVSGKIVYTAHDSEELLFHTGIVFVKFNLDSDQEYLKSRLGKH